MWKNLVELEKPQETYGACTFHTAFLKLQTHPASLRMLNTHVCNNRNKVAPCPFENANTQVDSQRNKVAPCQFENTKH